MGEQGRDGKQAAGAGERGNEDLTETKISRKHQQLGDRQEPAPPVPRSQACGLQGWETINFGCLSHSDWGPHCYRSHRKQKCGTHVMGHSTPLVMLTPCPQDCPTPIPGEDTG